MDLIRTAAADPLPPAPACDLAAILCDDEWDALLEVAERADPADPAWGVRWERAPLLLAY